MHPRYSRLPCFIFLWLSIISGYGASTGIHRELYLGVTGPGDSMAQLTNHPNFLAQRPNSTNIFTSVFETESNRGDDYGQRLRGYLAPPLSGDYTFWIASDEISQLFLSTDENPLNKRLIAFVDPRSQPRVWTTHPNQQSTNITLQAGQRYYLEVLHKEGELLDHLAVRWRLPSGVMEEPIPGSRFVYELPPLLAGPLTNLTVEEGRLATLSPALANFLPQQYQWQRNGADIPGATNQTLVLNTVKLADDGAKFRVIISNKEGSTNSNEATLTVLPDKTPPRIVSVVSVNVTNVLVRFSESVFAGSALDPRNYALNVPSTFSVIAVDPQTVLLQISPSILRRTYDLIVSNIADLASSPNLISPAPITFTTAEFAVIQIGSQGPAIPMSGNLQLDISGGGTGEAKDRLAFAHQLQAGDFDLKVRVAALDAADIWATAGLMARQNLDDDAPFVAVFGTPSLAGCFFEERSGAGQLSARMGHSPAEYPNVWFRLKRAGDIFTAFTGNDGERWHVLGTAAVKMPERIFVGPAGSSRSESSRAKASFEDFGPVLLTGEKGPPIYEREPLGPSSRKTGLVISEIMYHGKSRAAGSPLEFVEIFNSNPFYEDISGYRLSGEIDYVFPPGTILAGGAFLVVANDPAALRSAEGITNVLGPFEGKLANDAGRIRLRNDSDHVLLEANYSGKYPWPQAADGAGHSLVLARPSYGEGRREAWAPSDRIGGSSGRQDPAPTEPLRFVVINEVLADAAGFIELHNRGDREIDLSDAVLMAASSTNRFRFPSGSGISAHGLVAITAAQLGFAPSSSGDRIYFFNAAETRVVDSVAFEGQAPGLSSGRFPDGAPKWRELATPTLGSGNAPRSTRPIVFNEIMYNPISGDANDEYVELYNRATNSVDLGGWKFLDGIDFTFPANARIAAGGYAVVAKNLTNLLAKHPLLNTNNTFGNFTGTLSHSGERLAVGIPQTPSGAAFVIVDEVEYGTGGQWGQWADGGGSSLELIDPRADRDVAGNWAGSDETAKAPWTTVEWSGVLDNAAGSSDPPNTLHVMLLEAGECLLDDVEVTPVNSANRVSNPSFEAGLAGWISRGNHIRSSWETNEGFNSAHSLHIRASSQGDINANRIRIPLNPALTVGQTATIRAKARWLAGWPEILLRLRGSGLEAFGRLALPASPGTPGERNSRFRQNAGPAIYAVNHSPVAPAALEPVLVSARVSDEDGIASVTLKYRLDPSTNVVSIAMNDAGLDGDVTAGDGIFSATLPGQPADKVAAFKIEALDAAAQGVTTVFPATPLDNGFDRECVIHFGSAVPASSFATYRLWLTQTNITTWANREILSNERQFGTFVYGDVRAVYNAGGRFSGSPAHQDQAGPVISPVGNPYQFALDMPVDDQVLGTDSFNKIHAPGNNICDDNSLQRETTAYWMARQLGLASNHKRYVQFFVNGQRRCTVYEDTLVPSSSVVDSVFPDDTDGDLFKLSIWYEFDQANTQVLASRGNGGTTLNRYTTTGGTKKTARYRWNWQPRALNGTANNFTNLFALIDAANTPIAGTNRDDLISNLESLVDMRQWMRTFALEHAVGNWDSFGFRNAQNMYAYKPEHDRWQLLIWDINIVFGGGTRGTPVGPAGDNLLEYATDDVPLGRIYTTPKFLRWYWQAIREVANGPMLPDRLGPLLDSRSAAFGSSGLDMSPTDALKTWIAVRRQYLLQRLAVVDTPTFSASASLATNSAALTGAAPLEAVFIKINGTEWPVAWFTVTNWSARLALRPGTNLFAVEALNAAAQTIAATNLTVLYSGEETPLPRVSINEWMADNGDVLADPADGQHEDWFELFNAGSTPADLSGFYLTDNLTNKTLFAIPNGTMLPAGGFLLVWADNETFQRGSDLHAGFKLDQDGDSIGLFAPDGRQVDAVSFSAQIRNKSQGRWPDGAARIETLTPTPRAANALATLVPPTFVGYTLAANELRMTWNVVPGTAYRLEYKTNLNEAAWTGLGPAMNATTAQWIATDTISRQGNRFYRLAAETGAN